MDLPQCHYRISVKGLLLDETRTKFLITQEDNGRWCLPGGGLEHGEEPHNALHREVKEEMGIEVTWIAGAPCFFLACENKSEESEWVANVFYEMKVEHLNFTPSDECVAVRFVTSEEALALPARPAVYKFAELFRDSKSNLGGR